jgi:DNA-binding NarL/FixJ family response regulator
MAMAETLIADVVSSGKTRPPGSRRWTLSRRQKATASWKMKSMYSDIPIIILTSYDLPEYREAAKEYQADHFLSKGTTTKEDILKMVKSILTKRGFDLNGHE